MAARRIAEATERRRGSGAGPKVGGAADDRGGDSVAAQGPRKWADHAARQGRRWFETRAKAEDQTKGGGGEKRAAAVMKQWPSRTVRRAQRCDRSGEGSRRLMVADERSSRRVAVDVDDGSGRRRRRWWRRIFGDGAAAEILAFQMKWVCEDEEESPWFVNTI
ncbi:hypothetical protein Scep_004264 [Stephania cephalantha]|uniref:Uncharacterized protein n=1 Tax=Stephania cephalantha TaxID=152367 RepID=A0AAP0PWI0_9MAGN